MGRGEPDFLPHLARLLPPGRVLHRPVELLPYESDALTAFRVRPRAVVIPESRDEVIAVVRWCHAERIPFVARGSGTSLSGGSLPVEEGIVLVLSKLDRILDLDPVGARAVVEPGVINSAVSRAGEPHGLYYAPDPSSQSICTLGGNVAFNSGGAHCLKHGMTSNHVLGLEVILADGTLDRIGSRALEGVGPDLPGIFVGSEGLFGVALEITLRLLPRPECFHTLLAAYDDLGAAGEAVAAVLGAGLLPGALEIMDRLAIEAAEAAVDAGYPRRAGGLLIVELEGERHQVAAEARILDRVIASTHPFETRLATDDAERARIWQGRKGAFSAVGRLSPDYLVQDGVVPRTRLGEALTTIERLSHEHGLRIANVFHAGDGNLHPLILYDGRRSGELERAEALSAEILRLCIRLGGSITGEHGIGVEKREFLGELFAPEDLALQLRLRQAMDPAGIANPGKGFPFGAGPAPGPPISASTVARSVDPGGRQGATGESRRLRPTSPDEVATLVARAARQGFRLRCRGGGSKGALSAPSPGLGILDLSALSGVLEYDPAELTLTVAAGTPLSEIEGLLASEGQCLPFEPPLVGAGATLGGTLACGLAGPGRLRHGGVRDFLLGVRFVDGTGTLIRGGGKVVKNAAGFDLPKLLVGSLGRLGVVVEATFKVFPEPRGPKTFCVVLDRETRPWELLRRLALSPLGLEAVDLELRVAEPATLSQILWLRLGATAESFAPRLERLEGWLARQPGTLEAVALDNDGMIAASRDQGPWHRLRGEGSERLVRLPLAPGEADRLDPALHGLAAAGVRVLASAAGQVLWLMADGGADRGELAAWKELGVRAATLGRRALVLRWSGGVEEGPPPIGDHEPEGAVGDRVRHALDPHGVFDGPPD